MRLLLDTPEIELVNTGLGKQGFQVGTLKLASEPLGPSLGRAIPPGTRILFAETTGCPIGWTKVTGVNGYHLRVGDVANAGDTNAADSTTHNHDQTRNEGPGSEGASWASVVDNATPTLTYPAIKYLLCEKE